MKKTLLYLIWRHDKMMFIGLIVFVILQTLFIYKGVETSPFYLYGMYSAPYQSPPSQKSYQIKTKDGEILPLKPFALYQLRGFNSQINRRESLIKTIKKRCALTPYAQDYLMEHLVSDTVSTSDMNHWISSWYFVDSCIIDNVPIFYE